TDAPDDIAALRPSLPLAVGVERAKGQDDAAPAALLAAWPRDTRDTAEGVLARLIDLNVEDRCRRLLESYKEEAIRSLAVLDEPTLKGLLRRIVGTIFTAIEVKGWCR